uniref:Post-SET domain-containing protein n=1 Tax=Salix viminalis TaxID=40686 RepID=A0A6N2NJD2_SALVM
MQIQVKCSCGAENCREWVVVELQGTESYTFTVGYHELTGSKVTLKKPLLVLKKVKGFMDVDQSDDNKGDLPSSKIELDVIGIIRHKILFKTRPRALISKLQPLVKERVRSEDHAVPN